MSIRDALALKHQVIVIGENEFTIRRPSVLDYADAIEFAKEHTDDFPSWLVYRHLMEDGNLVFASVDEVKQCDGRLVNAIAKEIDALYGEGLD